MFTNYLKIAFRNLWKYKVYSFINISGLAAGLACCLLIVLYVQDELSYDRFHKNARNIYSFVDRNFEQQYRAEQRMGSVLGYFTVLAIFIAYLGIFGLVSFSAENRTKEIGIRKILGASVAGIVNLLSKEFLKLVLLANLLAWPIAWYAMHCWLENFAYRIDITWWVFPLAGGLALVIALLTASHQAIKATLANPVEALRYE